MWMTDSSRYKLHDAYILHSRPYRESSIILDLFTREYGRISVLAKGAKKNKRSQFAVLQPFTPIIVSWVGKGELHTLTNVELNGVFKYLYGTTLLCGYYVNELIMRFLDKEDPYEILYTAYSQVIVNLRLNIDVEPVLRQFECVLFQELGYGLNLILESETGKKVESTKSYYFDIEQGPVLEKLSDASMVVSGETLLSLESNNLISKKTLSESKKLMRFIINHHISGKPLKTHQLKWKYSL